MAGRFWTGESTREGKLVPAGRSGVLLEGEDGRDFEWKTRLIRLKRRFPLDFFSAGEGNMVKLCNSMFVGICYLSLPRLFSAWLRVVDRSDHPHPTL